MRYIMRGSARVCTFLAVVWSIGYAVDLVGGGWITAASEDAFQLQAARVFVGILAPLCVLVASGFLWWIGGGEDDDSKSDPY